jgi:Cysteine-rich CWC
MEIEKTTGIAQGPCWCVAQDFSADLLAKVPPSAQHQACICDQCVISAKNTATAT